MFVYNDMRVHDTSTTVYAFCGIVESIAPLRPHFLFCVIMVLQASSIQIAEEVTEENDYGSIYVLP